MSANDSTSPSSGVVLASLHDWLDSARDWEATELGPPSSWSAELRCATELALPLASVVLLWGPRMLRVYGPLYAALLGDRHPAALGEPVDRYWPDAWTRIAPYVERARSTRDSVTAPLVMVRPNRFGVDERLHLHATFTPVADHQTGEILAVALAAHDRTSEVLDERRLEAIEAVGEVSVFNRSVPSTAARALRGIVRAEDVRAAGAVLAPTRGNGEPAIVEDATAGDQPQALRQLLEVVRECYGAGCNQPDAGCRFDAWSDPRPTEDDVASRSIDNRDPTAVPVAQCRKLPGVHDADDVGRLVVALDAEVRSDGEQHAFLQRITRQTARALRDARADARSRHDVDSLTHALDSNRMIGVAMGILMALNKITPGQAFEELRATSQNANRKLRDVARDVVQTGELPAVTNRLGSVLKRSGGPTNARRKETQAAR